MAVDIRTEAFGQLKKSNLVDELGIWLSLRQIRKWLPQKTKMETGLRIADLGCGYHATIARRLETIASRMTLVDVSLSPELRSDSKVMAIEGGLPHALGNLHSESQDVILLTSVLEHLDDPQGALGEIYRLLAAGGVCLINVPSWRGKWFLEFSAFRLGLSPADEMNDHKMYYDPKDLWPLLVKAGFVPQYLRVFRHKFTLNTFAVCRKEPHDS